MAKDNYDKWKIEGDHELYSMKERKYDGNIYLTLIPYFVVNKKSFGAMFSSYRLLDVHWKDYKTALLTISEYDEHPAEIVIAMHFIEENLIYCSLESMDDKWKEKRGSVFIDFGKEYMYIRGEKVK
jgi:hypothetical protein